MNQSILKALIYLGIGFKNKDETGKMGKDFIGKLENSGNTKASQRWNFYPFFNASINFMLLSKLYTAGLKIN